MMYDVTVKVRVDLGPEYDGRLTERGAEILCPSVRTLKNAVTDVVTHDGADCLEFVECAGAGDGDA